MRQDYSPKQAAKYLHFLNVFLVSQTKECFTLIFMVNGADVGSVGIHIVWINGKMNVALFCHMW